MERAMVRRIVASGLAAMAVLGQEATARAMDRFSAPTGQLGANLSFDHEQRFRAHTEMSYFTSSGATTLHALGWTFGVGVKVTDAVEVEVALPVAGAVLSGGGTSLDQFGVGNLSLGANYFKSFTQDLRLKVGGLVAFGPWNQSNDLVTGEGVAVYASGVMTGGYQDVWLYLPSYVHLVVPARVEFGGSLQATGDASLQVAIPTLDSDTEVFVMVAPGVAFWATPQFSLGARMPLQFMTMGSDAAQISLEPYLRLDVAEQAFVSTRFTVHMDDVLGFSFDDGGVWGLHLAFGGSF
jgi:hypothetical protein